jgi:hypothetical protein
MKAISTILLVLLLASCTTVQQAQVDSDYVIALSTANKFLEAWRGRRQNAGLALLSPRLIEMRTEDQWRMAISGASNPHHQSYELTSGRRFPDGRIQFDIWLYEHYTGQQDEPSTRGKPEHIILIKVNNKEWKVDEVPLM